MLLGASLVKAGPNTFSWTELRVHGHISSGLQEKITTLMEELFKELDDDFLTEHDCPDGSTAIIALVLGTDLFIANLGRDEWLTATRTTSA